MENWHIMFHDENCKKIYRILNDCFLHHCTEEQAAEEIKQCDLSGLEGFQTTIRKEAEKLMLFSKQKGISIPNKQETEVFEEEQIMKQQDEQTTFKKKRPIQKQTK